MNNSLLNAAKKNNYKKVLSLLSQGAKPDEMQDWYKPAWDGSFYFPTFHKGCLVLKDAISPNFKVDMQIFKLLLAASEKENFLKFSGRLFEKACNADRQDLATLILQLRECYGVNFNTEKYGKITIDSLATCRTCMKPEKWFVFMVSLGLCEKHHDLFSKCYNEAYNWALDLRITNEAYEKLVTEGKAAYQKRTQEYNGVQTFILNRCEIPKGVRLVEESQIPVTFVGAEEFHKRIASFDKIIDDTLQSECTAIPFPKEITDLVVAYVKDFDFHQMMQCMKYDLEGELKDLKDLIEEKKTVKQPTSCCMIQ